MTVNLPAAARQLRLAGRSLLRAPAFSSAVIASLAISVAAITTVYSVADAVLLRTLPYRDPEALVWIASVRPNRNDAPLSLPEFMDYAAQARSVDVAAYTQWNAAMATSSVAKRLEGMRISGNGLQVLGAVPAAGRLLRPEDDRPEAPRVVVLSHAFWIEEFGGDRGVIGRVLRLHDQPYEVVGVLPEHLPLHLTNPQVVVPLQPELDPRRHVRRSTNFLFLFGRIRPGATIVSADQELDAIARSLRDQFPSENANKLGIAVTPLKEFLVGGTRQTFVVMLGAATLLLLIALANVLNLILIRGIAKKGEMALRRALGGSGHQIAAGAVAEAVVLAAAGTATGAFMAHWIVSLAARNAIGLLRLGEARVAGRALLLVVVVSALATLLFALIQLAAAMRATPRQAMAAMARGLHGSRGEARLRASFLVAQLGFATLLTIVTATMARSLSHLQSVDLGYRPDSVFFTRVSLPPQRYGTRVSLARFAQDQEAALLGAPGVVAAGAISIAPLTAGLAIIPFTVVGRAPEHERERLEANLRGITPGYLAAIGARVGIGREFTPSDDESGAPVAIVSRALAAQYLGEGDPVGRQLLVNDNDVGPRPLTVVGVVDDMRHVRLDGPPEVDIYIPLSQYHPASIGFVSSRHFWVARLSTGGGDAPRTFVRAFETVDRDVAISSVVPMREQVDLSLAPRRVSVHALVGFAGVALVLATVGVYGVVAYSVTLRRREIGLRLALGASAAAVMRTFLRPALKLAIVGVVIGLLGALATRRLVAGLLFGVTPTSPRLLIVVGLALLMACALAALIPARRATKVDPAITLRDS